MYNRAIERFKNEKIGVVIESAEEYERYYQYLTNYGWNSLDIPKYDARYNCHVCNWMEKKETLFYPSIINGSPEAVIDVSHRTWELIKFEELFRPDIKINEEEFLSMLMPE